MQDLISSQWVSLIGASSDYLLLTYIKTGLVTGTDYKFRIRARNMHGFGPYSDVVTIRADDVPA